MDALNVLACLASSIYSSRFHAFDDRAHFFHRLTDAASAKSAHSSVSWNDT